MCKKKKLKHALKKKKISLPWKGTHPQSPPCSIDRFLALPPPPPPLKNPAWLYATAERGGAEGYIHPATPYVFDWGGVYIALSPVQDNERLLW